jgi:hypothetical protein
MGPTQAVVRPVEMSLSELSRTSPTWLYVARPQIGAPRGRRGPSGGGCSGRRPTTVASGPVTLGCNLAPRHGRDARRPPARGRCLSGGRPRVPGHRSLHHVTGFPDLDVTACLFVAVVTSHEADDAVIWLPTRRIWRRANGAPKGYHYNAHMPSHIRALRAVHALRMRQFTLSQCGWMAASECGCR